MKIIRCHLCWDGFYAKSLNAKFCPGCKHRASLIYHYKYKKRNRKKFADWERRCRQKRKLKVFNQYGGAICGICSNDDFDVLTIDHINCGGTKHRKSFKNYDGQAIYRWLVENDYPEGFRVLCRNCNWKEHLRLNYGK